MTCFISAFHYSLLSHICLNPEMKWSSGGFFISWPCCMFCFHAFSPVPTISWRRVDGASFGRKVDINKASGVLEIPYFQQEDAGIYECVAENSRGRNSVKGKLSFYGEWAYGFTDFDLKRTLLHTSCLGNKTYLLPSTCQSSSTHIVYIYRLLPNLLSIDS